MGKSEWTKARNCRAGMLSPAAILWVAIRILAEFIFQFPPFSETSGANFMKFPSLIPRWKRFGNPFLFCTTQKIS